jgi:hypothetical protein
MSIRRENLSSYFPWMVVVVYAIQAVSPLGLIHQVETILTTLILLCVCFTLVRWSLVSLIFQLLLASSYDVFYSS